MSVQTANTPSKGGFKLTPIFWQGRIMPAFWTVASVLSLVVNIILIVVLVILGRMLFEIKYLVNDGLISGLYQNFVLMDQAHIQTTIIVEDTILVEDTIPVVFDLPLNQKTEVVLTENISVPNTLVYLNGMAVPTTVVLPAGTPLSIQLDLVVPVNQTIPVVLNVPVKLKVPVDIPLESTQLHQPFTGLQEVVSPYHKMLSDLPDAWEDTPVCGPMTLWLCRWLFALE